MQITMKEITTTLFHLTPCMLKFQCVQGKVILNKVSQEYGGEGGSLLPKCTSWNQYLWTKCAFGELPTLASEPYLWKGNGFSQILVSREKKLPKIVMKKLFWGRGGEGRGGGELSLHSCLLAYTHLRILRKRVVG